MSSNARLRAAADIGGTFTDVAAFDERQGRLLLGKTLTTPDKLVGGILTGLDKAGVALPQADLFLHGSTVAINTMLERSGAHTALITTRGFRDIYEIGRINRPDSFNLRHHKHTPLVERDLRFEVTERMLASGEVHIPLDEAEVLALARRLKQKRIAAVAVVPPMSKAIALSMPSAANRAWVPITPAAGPDSIMRTQSWRASCRAYRPPVD